MESVTPDKSGTCNRLKSVREQTFGLRGRAAFARALGLSPSTYIYYEKGRVPPADVLARAAEVAGVQLQWLVTGEGRPETPVSDLRRQWSAGLPADLQVALDRFLDTVGPSQGSPAAGGALAAILAEIRARFPEAGPAAWTEQPVERTDGMVPILGRTAAGLVGTTEALLGEKPAVSVADIARRAMGLDVRMTPAVSMGTDDPVLQSSVPALAEGVALVQLSEPLPSGVIEFVDAPAIRAAHPEAFAVRVDGESMSPRFEHGDVVIAAAGRPVRSGQAALVKIHGRVGLTLKLVRRDDDAVHLVPINERYETERLASEEIDWLAPVLVAARFPGRRSAS